MTLVKTGPGITDIRGGTGGVYFHRDKSGLHCCRKPRVIRRRSSAQDAQRDAFSAARKYSKNNRTVSYLMYRYMNGLSLLYPPEWTRLFTFTDPDNKWTDRPSAYDGDPDTNAYYLGVLPNGWQKKLVFHPRVPLLCSNFRYSARLSPGFITEMRVQLSYQGQDTAIFSGAFPNKTLTEIPFAERMVDGFKIWFKTINDGRNMRIYQVGLYTHWNPLDGSRYCSVPIDYQIPKL